MSASRLRPSDLLVPALLLVVMPACEQRETTPPEATSARSDAVVDPHLVTHWTFDEVSGKALDMGSDGSRDATLQNGAVRVAGKPGFGKALSLDGVNDRAVFPNHSVPSWGSQITVAAWIKTAPPHGGSYGTLLYRLLGDAGSSLLFSGSGVVLFGKLGVAPSSYPEIATYDFVPAATWVHVALRYDGARWGWFRNGIRLAAGEQALSGSLVTGSAQGYIGQTGTAPGTYRFKGQIDDVRIYDVALSDAAVADLAGRVDGGPELVARYGFSSGFEDATGDHPCTAVGSPQIVQDPARGKVLSLDGASSLTCGNAATLDVTGPTTIAAWVKTTAPSAAVAWPLVAKEGSYGLHVLQTGCLFFDLPGVLGNQGDAWCGHLPATADGTWHHVAVTYDGARARVAYVDGRWAHASAADAGPISTSSGALRIGAVAGGSGTYVGAIDEVRVYRAALTPSQVRDLADPDLVSHWTFDEGGPTAIDSGSSDARHATLMNGATRSSSTPDLGQALSLDGVDDHAIFQNPTGATWGSAMTVAAWIRPSPPHGSNYGALVYRPLGDGGTRVLVSTSGTVLFGKLGIAPDSYPELVAYETIPANAWSHVAMRYDGATWSLWLNGEKKTETSLAGTLASGVYQGAIGETAGTYRYKGLIDDLRLYDRALAPGEIWRLARPDVVHVAPAGSASAWGSPLDPVDWRSAFEDFSIVGPGSTVWFAGGTYHGDPVVASSSTAFHKTGILSGTAAKPIVYRAAAGARAKLTVAPGEKNEIVLRTAADHVRWRGFEVSAGPGSGQASDANTTGSAVWIEDGDDVELLDLVVHDNPKRTGITDQNAGVDHEVNGCLVYGNGGESSAQSWHGIYPQNHLDTIARYKHTLVFANHGHGFHAYGALPMSRFELDGVVAWSNGIPHGVPKPNILVGTTGASTSDLTLDGCMTYFPSFLLSPHWGARLGYVDPQPNAGLLVTNGVFANGYAAANLFGWSSGTFQNNVVYGSNQTLMSVTGGSGTLAIDQNHYHHVAGVGTAFEGDGLPLPCDLGCWRANTGWDLQSTTGPLPPLVRWLPNDHEAERAFLVVYDFPCFGTTQGACASGAASVNVTLTDGLPFVAGDTVRIVSVEDVWGAPVVQGTVAATTIALPMTGTHAPEFAVYLVQRNPLP